MLPRFEHILLWPLLIALPHDVEPWNQENEEQRPTAQVRSEFGKSRADYDIVDNRCKPGIEERVREQSHIAASEPQLPHRLCARLTIRPDRASYDEPLKSFGLYVGTAREAAGHDCRDGRLPRARDPGNHEDCGSRHRPTRLMSAQRSGFYPSCVAAVQPAARRHSAAAPPMRAVRPSTTDKTSWTKPLPHGTYGDSSAGGG